MPSPMTRQNPSSDETDEEYAAAYERGWRYSGRPTASLDTADSRGWSRSEGWMDGYLDRATGRAKWHYRDCPVHDSAANGGCGEA